MSTQNAPGGRVCGALGCHNTEGIRIVRTQSYGQRALCPEHRDDLRTDIRSTDHHGSWREVRQRMHLEGDGGHE